MLQTHNFLIILLYFLMFFLHYLMFLRLFASMKWIAEILYNGVLLFRSNSSFRYVTLVAENQTMVEVGILWKLVKHDRSGSNLE